jgi:LysR family transcriptional regulator AphB
MQHDLNNMMVFLAVVETGSFTLAADRLGMPKANVSRKVSKLETTLGITLLERSTRSQHLTEAGKRYLIHCKRVQDELNLASSSVSELMYNFTGSLKIGASISTGHHILKPALSKFMHQYPELKIQLNLVNRRIDFIEEGFDLVIRIGQLKDSNLIAKKLGTVSRKLFASPDYLEKYGEPNSIELIEQHQMLIMNPFNNDLKLRLTSDKGQIYRINSQPRLFVDDFAILQQGIVDGLGIGVLPEYMCHKQVTNGELQNILPSWGLESVDVYALYPRNRGKLPKVKAFLTFILDLYQQALKSH